MTLEDQVWEEVCRRQNYFSAKQLCRAVGCSYSYAKMLLGRYVVKGIVEMRQRDKTKLYRIPK
jgi:hypothetical protein